MLNNPIRSGFPDGPDPDFFEEIGPDLVRIGCEKSDFVVMLLLLPHRQLQLPYPQAKGPRIQAH